MFASARRGFLPDLANVQHESGQYGDRVPPEVGLSIVSLTLVDMPVAGFHASQNMLAGLAARAPQFRSR